jgi:maleate cis-trans isomerase
MFGWRARIGSINPGVYLYSKEWDKILPDGIVWAVMSLGVVSLTTAEFAKAGEKIIDAGKTLGTREVGHIFISGTPMCLNIGYNRAKELAQAITKATGVNTVLALDDIANAFKALSAKRVTIATPYSPEINAAHSKFLADNGITVVNAKGLQLVNNVDITKQPDYMSYRLAKQAYSENTDVDAIWVGCPAWPVLSNVDRLEQDTGKPVISDMTASLYIALKHLGIRGPVKGFGRLLEML